MLINAYGIKFGNVLLLRMFLRTSVWVRTGMLIRTATNDYFHCQNHRLLNLVIILSIIFSISLLKVTESSLFQ